MKFILKILLAPMVYVMYLLILFLTFVLSISTVILNIAATLIGVLAVFAIITESVSNGIVMLVIAWMLSPVNQIPLMPIGDNLRVSIGRSHLDI